MKDPAVERRAYCFKFLMSFNKWYRKLPYDVIRNIIQRLSLFQVMNVFSFTMDEKMINAYECLFLKLCIENNLPQNNLKSSSRFLQYLHDVSKGKATPTQPTNNILPNGHLLLPINITFHQHHSDCLLPVQVVHAKSTKPQHVEIVLTYGSDTAKLEKTKKYTLTGDIRVIQLNGTKLYYVNARESGRLLEVYCVDLLTSKNPERIILRSCRKTYHPFFLCSTTHIFLTYRGPPISKNLLGFELETQRESTVPIPRNVEFSNAFLAGNEIVMFRRDGVATYTMDENGLNSERFIALGNDAHPAPIAGKGYIWIWHDDIWYYPIDGDRIQRTIGKTGGAEGRIQVVSQDFFRVGNTSYYFNGDQAINVTEWAELNSHVFAFLLQNTSKEDVE